MKTPEDYFEETYLPIEGQDGSTLWEYDELTTLPSVGWELTKHVWSVTGSSEGDALYVTAGMTAPDTHGYMVTTKPWTEGSETYRLDSPEDETEHGQKRLKLALALYQIAYPELEVSYQMFDNYIRDADNVLRSMPHLLSMAEFDRLKEAGFFEKDFV